jgi:hypothetical protein
LSLRTAPIQGSEVRKMAVSLCFVKSAKTLQRLPKLLYVAFQIPDLTLLTLKHRKSHFSRAAMNGAKRMFCLLFQPRQKVREDYCGLLRPIKI